MGLGLPVPVHSLFSRIFTDVIGVLLDHSTSIEGSSGAGERGLAGDDAQQLVVGEVADGPKPPIATVFSCGGLP